MYYTHSVLSTTFWIKHCHYLHVFRGTEKCNDLSNVRQTCKLRQSCSWLWTLKHHNHVASWQPHTMLPKVRDAKEFILGLWNVMDPFQMQMVLDWFLYHQGFNATFSTLFWPLEVDRETWRPLRGDRKHWEEKAARQELPPPKVQFMLGSVWGVNLKSVCWEPQLQLLTGTGWMALSLILSVSWVVNLCWYMLSAFRFSKSSAF